MINFCEAMTMGFTSFDCKHCGCNWSVHMHISCEYYKEKRTLIKQDVQDKIDTEEAAIEKINRTIRQLDQLVQEYRSEVATVQEISAKFAYILSTNSYFVSLY